MLLTTLGGPCRLEEIPDFIKRFLGRELPPPALKGVIDRYRLIGGFSPLPGITGQQAERLGEILGGDYICRPAFRYSRPFIEEAIEDMVKVEVRCIIFLILSPFYTRVTTGDYINAAQAHMEKKSLSLPVEFIHSWYNEPLFLRSWEEKIKGEAFDEDAFYLFSAHSLPLKHSDEPYQRQIVETVERLAALAGIRNHALGWQSIPPNPVEPWITPTVEEKIDAIAAAGFRSLIQVPIGFTADHIETLYDVDITHRQYALARALSFRRVPSLNAGDTFIRALKEMVIKFEGKVRVSP
ncbi:MAG: ferrochelatase [Smithellaceae bacterium]|nr:ferrochelatase [Smithellaceae bacterium]